MGSDQDKRISPHQPEIYEIRVQGHILENRRQWFDEMTIIHEPDGITLLRGELPDQSALHGILARLRDMNLPVISVRRLSPDEPTENS